MSADRMTSDVDASGATGSAIPSADAGGPNITDAISELRGQIQAAVPRLATAASIRTRSQGTAEDLQAQAEQARQSVDRLTADFRRMEEAKRPLQVDHSATAANTMQADRRDACPQEWLHSNEHGCREGFHRKVRKQVQG